MIRNATHEKMRGLMIDFLATGVLVVWILSFPNVFAESHRTIAFYDLSTHSARPGDTLRLYVRGTALTKGTVRVYFGGALSRTMKLHLFGDAGQYLDLPSFGPGAFADVPIPSEQRPLTVQIPATASSGWVGVALMTVKRNDLQRKRVYVNLAKGYLRILPDRQR